MIDEQGQREFVAEIVAGNKSAARLLRWIAGILAVLALGFILMGCA